jgi:hypothetical protein
MREVDRQTAAVMGASNCIGKPTSSVWLGNSDADSAIRTPCVPGFGKMQYSQGEQPKVNLNLSAYNWRSPMASAFGQKTSI